MTEAVEQKTDHAEEARELLQITPGDIVTAWSPDNDQAIHAGLQLAQVHAQLAIADELRGIRELLADVIDPTAGPSFPGVVRVRTEASDG